MLRFLLVLLYPKVSVDDYHDKVSRYLLVSVHEIAGIHYKKVAAYRLLEGYFVKIAIT